MLQGTFLVADGGAVTGTLAFSKGCRVEETRTHPTIVRTETEITALGDIAGVVVGSGIVAGGVGIYGLADDPDREEPNKNELRGAGISFVATGLAVVGLSIWDMARSPSVEERTESLREEKS